MDVLPGRQIETLRPLDRERVLKDGRVYLLQAMLSRADELREPVRLDPAPSHEAHVLMGCDAQLPEPRGVEELPLHVQVGDLLGLGDRRAGEDHPPAKEALHGHDHRGRLARRALDLVRLVQDHGHVAVVALAAPQRGPVQDDLTGLEAARCLGASTGLQLLAWCGKGLVVDHHHLHVVRAHGVRQDGHLATRAGVPDDRLDHVGAVVVELLGPDSHDSCRRDHEESTDATLHVQHGHIVDCGFGLAGTRLHEQCPAKPIAYELAKCCLLVGVRACFEAVRGLSHASLVVLVAVAVAARESSGLALTAEVLAARTERHEHLSHTLQLHEIAVVQRRGLDVVSGSVARPDRAPVVRVLCPLDSRVFRAPGLLHRVAAASLDVRLPLLCLDGLQHLRDPRGQREAQEVEDRDDVGHGRLTPCRLVLAHRDVAVEHGLLADPAVGAHGVVREVAVEVVPERVVLALGGEDHGTPAHDAPVIAHVPVLVLEVLRGLEPDHAGRDGYVLVRRSLQDLLGHGERGREVGHGLAGPAVVGLEAPDVEGRGVVQALGEHRLAQEVRPVRRVLEQRGECRCRHVSILRDGVRAGQLWKRCTRVRSAQTRHAYDDAR